MAGDGRQGFGGEVARPYRAELRIGKSSGIAIASNGTVYFSDSGNGRVRGSAAGRRHQDGRWRRKASPPGPSW